jgi:hypothetical protein
MAKVRRLSVMKVICSAKNGPSTTVYGLGDEERVRWQGDSPRELVEQVVLPQERESHESSVEDFAFEYCFSTERKITHKLGRMPILLVSLSEDEQQEFWETYCAGLSGKTTRP